MTPRQELAILERCPECAAKPGDWCVYIVSPRPSPHYSYPSYQVARAGKPTKQLHNGRFHAAWVSECEAKRAKEIAMLREFFERFGSIFEEMKCNT